MPKIQMEMRHGLNMMITVMKFIIRIHLGLNIGVNMSIIQTERFSEK